tara:strand:- start:211 stop:354 length:144 start_codon:yes stop_codon:yes gene_type:complete
MKKEIGKKVTCINRDFGEFPSVYPSYGFPFVYVGSLDINASLKYVKN